MVVCIPPAVDRSCYALTSPLGITFTALAAVQAVAMVGLAALAIRAYRRGARQREDFNRVATSRPGAYFGLAFLAALILDVVLFIGIAFVG